MRTEVKSAVDFLSTILSKRNDLDTEVVDNFNRTLNSLLCTHYQDHWFPAKPFKGSGYRCLRIVNKKMDPLIAQAGIESGITESRMLSILPSELTMWVDPSDVSYRIGEEGSVGMLDLDNDDSTDSDSTCDSISSSSDSEPESPETTDLCQNFQQHYISEQQHNQQQEGLGFHQQQSGFFQNGYVQSCKNELQSYLWSTNAHEAMNMEYLANFVAS